MTLTDPQATLLRNAYYLWFTTVRADGTPQPTPIWFVQEGDEILIYSMPHAQKIKNINANSKVALNFNSDSEGEEYIVITGEATYAENGAPAVKDNPAYVAKYGSGIQRLSMTPESMGASYSTLIRVKITRARSE